MEIARRFGIIRPGRTARRCLFIVITAFGFLSTGEGSPCTAGDNLGNSNVNSLSGGLTTDSARQYLMTDSEYVASCCGQVSQWDIYAGATGTIALQVWHPSGGAYELVGENQATVTATGVVSIPVPAAQRVNVQANDVIGWYTSGTDIVEYKGGGSRNDNNYGETVVQPVVGETLSFSNAISDRTYAIFADLVNSPPSFLNLDASITLSKGAISTSSPVFTVTASHPSAGETLTFSVNSITPSADFTVNSTSGAVTSLTSSLSVATYTIVIRITDSCGNAVDGQLSIDIINFAPTIQSLPDVVTISESAVDETLLHTVNVTDPDGDVVTCNVTSTPSGPFTTKFISSGGTLLTGIYLQANPNLDYTNTSSYELSVSCLDTSTGSDSGILYVYITQNQAPVISNLQNTTSLYSNLSTSSIVFQVLATDAEGDALTFALSCVTAVTPCPFTIYSDGSIVLSSSLISTNISAYELDVSVSDAFSTSAAHRLVAFVQDLNVAPFITNLPASIQVREDASLNDVVFHVEVYDGNGDTSFTFIPIFSPPSSAALFHVNNQGQISVANALNYLTQANNYTITIQASDGQAVSVSQTLTIETVDVNQAPVLYQTHYSVEANEGSAGTSFPDPSYNVYDADSDNLSYSFGGGNSSAGFTINSTTGIIAYSITYDVDDTSTTETTFVWLITISDSSGLAATATLTVSILDINDNVPAFNSASYTGSVSSKAALGTIVLTVSSSDKDFSSEFREMEYNIYDTSLFRIDHNGNVFVYGALTHYGGSTDNGYIRVNNPGVASYDQADVAIYVYRSDSGHFFDRAANVAWVTLLCILVPLLVAVLAYLAYRCKQRSSAVKPPQQVAPYDTSLPATPSDIRVNDKNWQAWSTRNFHLWNP